MSPPFPLFPSRSSRSPSTQSCVSSSTTTPPSSATPVSAPSSFPESVLSASLGNRHALLLTQSGRVFAAGSEGVLQGRTQYLDTSLHFTPLPVLSTVSQVLCGAAHSLALTAAGDLFGWGEAACGQLPGCSAPRCTRRPHPRRPRALPRVA